MADAPHCVFLALSAAARKLDGTESRHPLGCRGGNGLLCTELIDTKLYRPTCRDTDASRSKYNLVRLAHCKCKSLMQQSSRLSSVCLSHVTSRKLSEIGAKFRHLYRKPGAINKLQSSVC